VVAAERQLLDYHQAQGVFYPLIQIGSAHPSSTASAAEGKQTSSLSASTRVGAGLKFQAGIAAAGVLILLIFSSWSTRAYPHSTRDCNNSRS